MTPKAEEIRSLLHLFERSTWNELRLETADFKIAVSKTGPLSEPAPSALEKGSPEILTPRAASIAAPAAAAALAAAPAPRAGGSDELRSGETCLRAPNLGVFWSKPKPDAAPFVVEQQLIAKGDTVCVIEVMKLFTQVVSTESGRVVRCLVTDGTMVEQDTPLFIIEAV